jgi:hypothetical protein
MSETFTTEREGQVFSVPRWRMVIETGHGYDELTDEEKRLAKEYLCTDQAPTIIESFRNLGRRYSERVEAAVMRAIGGANG